MNFFSRIKFGIAFSLLLIIISMSVCSHPGRTDENGGHWNRTTGEYHFHTGEYAGRNHFSSSPSSSSGTSPSKKIPDPPAKTKKSVKTAEEPVAKNEGLNTFELICIISVGVLLLFLICLGFHIHFKIISTISAFKSYKYEQHSLPDYKKELSTYERKLPTLKAKVTIPEEYEIGEDNLPKDKGAEDWGKTFTYYINPGGQRLHRKYGHSGAVLKVHIYQHVQPLCKVCCKNHTLPNLNWYRIYLSPINLAEKIIRLKQKISDTEKSIASYEENNSKNIKVLEYMLKKEWIKL